jgi:hypothetical protein
MRRLIRMAAALAAIGLMATLATTSVVAGNWAETSMVDGADAPPTAGEARELRFTLMQHGVTPVDFGTVELTATLPGSDERISAPATHVGAGEWTATVTFPVEGDWQLRVVHSVFETPAASTFSVAGGPGPAWLPLTASLAGLLLAAVALVAATRLLRSRPSGPTERSVAPGRIG